MFKRFSVPVLRYVVAILSVAIAVEFRISLSPIVGTAYPFVSVLTAILVTAWFGGFRPALFALVLGGLAANYYLMLPYGELGLPTPVEQVGMLLYAITGLGIALLGGVMHRAQQALREANAQLELRVHERTAELEQSKSSLEKSEQDFRLLVEGASNHAIFLLDTGGRVSTWNSGAEHIYGYPAEEIIGHHFGRFFPEEDLAAGMPEQTLARAELAGRYTEEAVRRRRDGTQFWARTTMTRVTGDDGKASGFVKITEDISERKRAEAAQREAEERLLSALRWSHTGG
jgi:PAS domain S-box-containing protein